MFLEGAREEIRLKDPAVKGFNVGINDGEMAGQTIFHAHVHLIPRRAGDVANPRGGVRHVILGKGAY
jgi:ATP adenylyltransferase